MGRRGWQFTGLGSSSQGWRARRHLNSVVRKRSGYLESAFARLMYRSLCKTHQQALNRTAKTALDLTASLISRRTLPRVNLVGNSAVQAAAREMSMSVAIVPTARPGKTGKIVAAREAARLIRTGDTVAIGGFLRYRACHGSHPRIGRDL